MTREEFTGVTFNDLDPSAPRISRSSEFSVVNSTEIALYRIKRIFLPERDYVTFGSLLSQFRLSSVTLMHHTQGVEPFGKISSPLCTLAIL